MIGSRSCEVCGWSWFVVEFRYFHEIRVFVSICRVPSALLRFLYRCLDFEVVGGRLWNVLVLLLEILTEIGFEDEI